MSDTNMDSATPKLKMPLEDQVPLRVEFTDIDPDGSFQEIHYLGDPNTGDELTRRTYYKRATHRRVTRAQHRADVMKRAPGFKYYARVAFERRRSLRRFGEAALPNNASVTVRDAEEVFLEPVHQQAPTDAKAAAPPSKPTIKKTYNPFGAIKKAAKASSGAANQSPKTNTYNPAKVLQARSPAGQQVRATLVLSDVDRDLDRRDLEDLILHDFNLKASRFHPVTDKRSNEFTGRIYIDFYTEQAAADAEQALSDLTIGYMKVHVERILTKNNGF